MRRKTILFALMMCLAYTLWAQPREVSGTVSDSRGPLIGVSVRVMGTNTVSVTDANGEFRIMATSEELFDKAEAAVADSPVILDRVRLSRMPIEFVKLMKPILDKQTKGHEAEHLRNLDLFMEKCRGYGIDSIREGQPLEAFYKETKAAIGG